MKKGGCWIFLSHSSQDIEKVRFVRNEFERHQHNPLAFHLRCLNDDTPEAKAELIRLIEREIDSREWFVYCESPDAAKSKYVADERSYIKTQGKQYVWSINMSLSEDQISARVKEICTYIKVFISFAQRDGAHIYDALSDALVARDYDVWDSSCDLIPGHPFYRPSNSGRIDQTVKNGFAVVLVTEVYARSQFCLLELERILASDAIVFPFVVGDAPIPDLLKTRQCFRIQREPAQQDIELIAEFIDTLLLNKTSLSDRSKKALQQKTEELYTKLNHLYEQNT